MPLVNSTHSSRVIFWPSPAKSLSCRQERAGTICGGQSSACSMAAGHGPAHVAAPGWRLESALGAQRSNHMQEKPTRIACDLPSQPLAKFETKREQGYAPQSGTACSGTPAAGRAGKQRG